MSNHTSVETERSGLSVSPLKIAVEGCVSKLLISMTVIANFGKGSWFLGYHLRVAGEGMRISWLDCGELDFLIICGDFQVNGSSPSVLPAIVNIISGCPK